MLARKRRPVSPIRRAEGSLRVFGLDAGSLTFAPPRPAGWDHLVTLRAGAATLHDGATRVLVTPALAVSVPAGRAYVLELAARCELRVLYLARDAARPRGFDVLAMVPLLRELIERATVAGYLDPYVARDARLLGVLGDELAALLPASPAYALTVPRDPALREAVETIVARIDDMPAIRTLAAAAHLSMRAFERRFARETGLAPREWARRARLCAAAAALASGASVTEAGFASGYASLSAFVAAYRALFGTTPGRASAISRQNATTASANASFSSPATI